MITGPIDMKQKVTVTGINLYRSEILYLALDTICVLDCLFFNSFVITGPMDIKQNFYQHVLNQNNEFTRDEKMCNVAWAS